MIGVVVVSHGRLADEFVAATEHVVGPMDALLAVCIGPDDDMEQRRADILASVEKVELRRCGFFKHRRKRGQFQRRKGRPRD